MNHRSDREILNRIAVFTPEQQIILHLVVSELADRYYDSEWSRTRERFKPLRQYPGIRVLLLKAIDTVVTQVTTDQVQSMNARKLLEGGVAYALECPLDQLPNEPVGHGELNEFAEVLLESLVRLVGDFCDGADETHLRPAIAHLIKKGYHPGFILGMFADKLSKGGYPETLQTRILWAVRRLIDTHAQTVN
ncbi:MAG: hypothetical protein HY459_04430 [Parcubacteria group bacterium]|nr:hypothetical protein [Parcubacteria group bacterium]